MPDQVDPDRLLAAYTSEVRALQRFFAVLLLGLGAFHLLLLAPYLELRAALPVVSARMAEARAQIKTAEDVQRATGAASVALAPFRQALAAAPERLRRAIGDLVGRGRLIAGAAGDPFKATIKVPKEGVQPATESEEMITVDEAIRRQIGKDVEALTTAFDQSLESLRTIKELPTDVEGVIREGHGAIGRDILSLNEILRAAFDADPYFWKRWERPGATLAAASPRADGAVRRIESGLQALSKALTNAAAQARMTEQEAAASIEALRANETTLKDRLTKSGEVLGSLPLSMDEAARIYPLVAFAFTLTALVRLRRLLRLRAAIGRGDADACAPSWLIAPPGWPGRSWSLVLVAAPLLAAVHGAAAAVRDPGLFVSVLGEPGQLTYQGTVAGYVVLGLPAIYHFALAARALLRGGRLAPEETAGR